MTGVNAIDQLRPGDPSRLGDYRLVGRIGRGGMGTVFLAESARGERVAVKVINPELADDETFRDRFRREVESARRVRRFCTAPVLDAQLDGEPLFIVTEFVDGPDLDEFVRDSGPMRGSSLEHLAVGVATALTAIHGAGVVHRDLKPANVLLSSVGPRVIDFGIARALDTVSGATRTGQFIGTPALHGARADRRRDRLSRVGRVRLGMRRRVRGHGTGRRSALPACPPCSTRSPTASRPSAAGRGPARSRRAALTKDPRSVPPRRSSSTA